MPQVNHIVWPCNGLILHAHLALSSRCKDRQSIPKLMQVSCNFSRHLDVLALLNIALCPITSPLHCALCALTLQPCYGCLQVSSGVRRRYRLQIAARGGGVRRSKRSLPFSTAKCSAKACGSTRTHKIICQARYTSGARSAGWKIGQAGA